MNFTSDSFLKIRWNVPMGWLKQPTVTKSLFPVEIVSGSTSLLRKSHLLKLSIFLCWRRCTSSATVAKWGTYFLQVDCINKNTSSTWIHLFFEDLWPQNRSTTRLADSLPPPLIQGVLGGGVHGVAGNGLPKPSGQKCGKNLEIKSAVYPVLNRCIDNRSHGCMCGNKILCINRSHGYKKLKCFCHLSIFFLMLRFLSSTCRPFRPGLFSAFATVFGFSAWHMPSRRRNPWIIVISYTTILVGGFNPFEKYLSNWIISPSFGVKIPKKCLSCPPPVRKTGRLASGVSKGESSCHFGAISRWNSVIFQKKTPHPKLSIPNHGRERRTAWNVGPGFWNRTALSNGWFRGLGFWGSGTTRILAGMTHNGAKGGHILGISRVFPWQLMIFTWSQVARVWHHVPWESHSVIHSEMQSFHQFAVQSEHATASAWRCWILPIFLLSSIPFRSFVRFVAVNAGKKGQRNGQIWHAVLVVTMATQQWGVGPWPRQSWRMVESSSTNAATAGTKVPGPWTRWRCFFMSFFQFICFICFMNILVNLSNHATVVLLYSIRQKCTRGRWMINTIRPLEINPFRNGGSLVAQDIWVRSNSQSQSSD